MRVLVVDPDESFASGVIGHLNQVGIEAVHASSPAQMDAHLRMRTHEAVLVDLSLRRMNGFDVARSLRLSHPSSELEIVLVSPIHSEDDPEIQTLKRDTACRTFLAKPVDLDALVQALQCPLASSSAPESPTAPSPEPRPGGSAAASAMGKKFDEPAPRPRQGERRFTIHWHNAKVLVDIWLSRRTGVLALDGKRSGQTGLVDGGVVDEPGRKLIRAALGGGGIRFRETHVDGVGDWRRMGKLLFKAAYASGDARTLRRHLDAIPTPKDVTPFARMLPLSDDARKFVSRIDGGASVESILDRESIPAGDVSKAVIALARLGLFDLIQDGASVLTGADDGPRTPKMSAPRVPQDEIAAAQEPDSLLQRLQRELETVNLAPPPVVLGLPADSSRAMVDRAGERMRERYTEIQSRDDISAEARELAVAILKRVEVAHRTFNFDAQTVTGGLKKAAIIIGDEVEVLLDQGRGHIEEKQWSQADSVLAQAHQKQIDHVSVLANLGWARLHNPDLALEVRTEEGKDFLLLAEQFDPRNAEGQYYLAQVLVASGMLEAAEERAARAVESRGSDLLMQALLKKIRVMRASEEQKAR